MKKIQFVCFILLFGTLQLNAQIRFGVKLGVSSTDIEVNDLMIDEPGLNDRLSIALENANYGIQAGIQIRAYLGNNVLLQPELIFNSNTVEFSTDDLDNPQLGRQLLEESYQYLDIPVLFSFELGPLHFNLGPVGHVYLDNTSDLFEFQDYDQNFNDLTLGYIYGVGLDIWNLNIDLRREGNFTNFGSHIRFGETRFEFDESPSRWLLTVGYFFGDRP